MSFSHVSRNVRDVTGKTFARKFITLGKVINYWAEAVGPDLALKTYPIGMKVRKAQAKDANSKNAVGRDLEAILEVAANSADATLIHYQKALILERLKMLIGGDMVVDIKITHAAVPVVAPSPAANFMKKPARVSKVDLSRVTDPELREVLERMGGFIPE